MEFRIEQQIIVSNEQYEALGDDFSIRDSESIKLLLDKVVKVISGEAEEAIIYGSICYKIKVTKNDSLIYCYDEYLGSEPSQDIYTMLNEWCSFLKEQRM